MKKYSSNEKLTMMSWNINQRSGVGGKENIAPIVFEEIKENNSDIIVLSEFVKLTGYNSFIVQLEGIGYVVMCDYRRDKRVNEILIAIKKEVLQGNDFIINTLPNVDTETNLYPNFLHVRFKYNGKELNIIGARIRISNSSSSDFQERRLQLDSLTKYVDKLNGATIIAGDFNNGYFKEGETSSSYSGKSREFYSYPLLKEESKAIGFELHTPKENGSWRNLKLDHILAKGANIITPIYDWGFTKRSNYKHNAIGIPDHAVLTASFSL